MAKPKPHRPRVPLPRPRELLARPPERFYRMPELVLRSGCLITEQCRRVLELSDEKICLDTGSALLLLYGRSLRIESFVGKRLVLTGRVSKLELRYKWEDADAP